MKSKIWLLISGALLISTHIQADDSDYNNRQFTVNPGNMMGGMFNPMRNFVGGSNRYSDDYYNYRYAPPPGYQPGYGYGYGYPGAAYGYPPVNPGYQPLPQAGGYPSHVPQQPPAAAARPEPPQAPVPTSYGPAAAGQSTYNQRYRFRPLETNGQPTEGRESDGLSPRQSLEPSIHPATQQPPELTTGARGMQPMKQGYGSNMELPTGSQTGQLKFRPLDKPGYSE